MNTNEKIVKIAKIEFAVGDPQIGTYFCYSI